MKLKVFEGIAELYTLAPMAAKDGRHVKDSDLGLIKDAAMVAQDGKILWLGERAKLKDETVGTSLKQAEFINLKAQTVLPAFVEAHTHLVFAGDRQDEFEMRNQGSSYQEIAQKGGGILSTVRKTRQASNQELVQLAQKRVNEFIRQGVATLEIKSGYGLSQESEIKILRVIRDLYGPEIVATYLGPHALSPECQSSPEYMRQIENDTLPLISKEGLAERVDMFVDQGYFTVEQAESYFSKAKKLGLTLTCHSDQMSHTGASIAAAKLGAQSVDHAIQISAEDIQILAKADTTVVLLPGADFYLHLKYPPARALIDAGARVALATDYNPGSCPTQDISFIGVLARLEMKMSFAEVLCAYTYNAAHSLGRHSRIGSLEHKKSCNFICLSGSLRDLFYQVGTHPVSQTWRAAEKI